MNLALALFIGLMSNTLALTDARGVEVEAGAGARVVSLGGSVTETVYALGEGHRVVGVDQSSLYPAAVHALPQVGTYRAASAEGVVSLKPDLVLADAHSGPPELFTQLEGAGVPVVSVPAEPSVEDAVAAILMVAEALGVEDEGAALVAGLQADLQRAADAAPAKPQRVLFVYARGGGTLNVSGRGTAADAMIRLAGAVNAVEGYEGYRPLTAESLVAAAPDVLLLTTRGLESMGGVEAFVKQPGVSLTPAGRAGAILPVDDLLLLGMGPRLGEGVLTLQAGLAELAALAAQAGG